MDRRAFIAMVSGSILGGPLAAEAQPVGKMPKIGVLTLDFADTSECVDRLRRGLGELGYLEGRTHVFEFRWAEGRMDLVASLAADLVRMNVDVIVSASATAAKTVKSATTTIPVVLASSFYPVESGIIASLAHPGGNITGVTHFTPELMAKRVQILKELLPTAGRFAVLRAPGQLQDLVVRDMVAAGQRVGTQLQVIEVRRLDDLPTAFEAAAKGRARAVVTTQAPFFWHYRGEIAQLALKHSLPSLSGEPTAAEAGTLIFYGPNVMDGCARAATYVDRILKGAKPADLPVEPPTKIKLVINLKTARTLGLTIPNSLLVRADKIIR